MFSIRPELQNETIAKEQVILGLELVDVELTEINEFNRKINELDEKYGLKISTELTSPIREDLNAKAADQTLTKLKQAKGWVLIEGDFNISETDTTYECSYEHPVSKFLIARATTVILSVSILKESIEPHLKSIYARSVGQELRLRVFGEVWPMAKQEYTLEFQMAPLAVY